MLQLSTCSMSVNDMQFIALDENLLIHVLYLLTNRCSLHFWKVLTVSLSDILNVAGVSHNSDKKAVLSQR